MEVPDPFFKHFPSCPRCSCSWQYNNNKEFANFIICKNKCGILVYYFFFEFTIHYCSHSQGAEIHQLVPILPHFFRKDSAVFPPILFWEKDSTILNALYQDEEIYHRFDHIIPFTISDEKISSLTKSIALLK